MTASPKPQRRKPGRPPAGGKRDTRRELLDAAARMFGSAGYQATSLRQIAGAANVDLATLKYHFNDKPTLFSHVFQRGHERLMDAIVDPLNTITQSENAEQLESRFRALIGVGLQFMSDESDFVRLSLYRLLEDADELSEIESEIEGVTLSFIDAGLQSLVERELINPIDTRSFLVMLLFGLPIWHVGAQTRPGLFGAEDNEGSAWRTRAEAFLLQTILSMLVPR